MVHGQYRGASLVLMPETEVIRHPCASASMGIFCKNQEKIRKKKPELPSAGAPVC